MKKYFEILTEFNRFFPSEERCLEVLCRLRWPDGFVCPRCGWREAWQIQPYKYKCRRSGCAYQVTPTAGTVFHRSHLPLRKWFMAAWYIAALGTKDFTAAGINEVVEPGSYHTALKISRSLGEYTPVSIKRLQRGRPPEKPLSGHLEVSNCRLLFMGKDVPVILLQSIDAEPAQFLARQSTDFDGETLMDFLIAHVAAGSNVENDPVAFERIGIQRRKHSFHFSPNYNDPPKEFPIRNAVAKLKKEWEWLSSEKENCPLGEFLENYPNRQSDPFGYRYNFEIIMKRVLREKEKGLPY